MLLEQLREFCLSLPDTEEGMPFGPDVLVFKRSGKIFLITGFDNSPLQFNVKCDPAKALELREQYPSVIPGFHMNKKHWNTVIVDGTVAISQLQKWIQDSYTLAISPKRKKKKP